MSEKIYHTDQMALVSVIMKELARQHPGLPAEARYVNRVIAAANSICDELAEPIVKAQNGMGLTAWLASDDVGMSSKFMASVLSGQFEASYAIPHDVADLGRCIRMIRAVPELADRVFMLGNNHGKKWAAIAKNWDRWCSLYDEERPSGKCPKLYSEMMAAYEEAGK